MCLTSMAPYVVVIEHINAIYENLYSIHNLIKSGAINEREEVKANFVSHLSH